MIKKDKDIELSEEDLKRAVTAPKCYHPGGWNETLPKNVVEAIEDARWDNYKKGVKKAADVEIMAYLYTAGFTKPLNDEASELLVWLTIRFFKTKSPNVIEELKSNMRYSENLAGDAKRVYEDMQHRIYAAVEKRITANIRILKQDVKGQVKATNEGKYVQGVLSI